MLRDTGFLSLPGTSCAHAVWLDDKDIKMLARPLMTPLVTRARRVPSLAVCAHSTHALAAFSLSLPPLADSHAARFATPRQSEAGATIVHNPASNLRLGSGVAPIRKYLAEGVNVCLGCDGAPLPLFSERCTAIRVPSLSKEKVRCADAAALAPIDGTANLLTHPGACSHVRRCVLVRRAGHARSIEADGADPHPVHPGCDERAPAPPYPPHTRAPTPTPSNTRANYPRVAAVR